MGNQQGPTLSNRELCSMLWGRWDGRQVWGRMNTCICVAESFCYPPDTITTLLIGYTPIKDDMISFKIDFRVLEKNIPNCVCALGGRTESAKALRQECTESAGWTFRDHLAGARNVESNRRDVQVIISIYNSD